MAVSRPANSSTGEVKRAPRARMTGAQRRLQLIEVARGLFAERGFEGTSIEEIAQRAGVSKPIVYEHFGGKEGLYAVVVDREMETLLEMITSSLSKNRSLYRIQQVALALLTYMEERTDGFRILVRGDSASSRDNATYGSLLNDAISQVEHILAGDFERRGFDPKLAPMYAQALVGMVSVTAQWWLDVREPSKEVVAAHLVNLCWNGLTRLDPDPELVGPDYVEHKARTVGDATPVPASAEGSGTPEALESSDASVPSDSVESP
ncbi:MULTISPECIES: TetR/AcrR family transcriptional regulator [Gordonia]|uniref:TetR family transcriptional regulator n=1 Tax=Gordonia jacobaea TaxID=122202 RepID=A0ABR5IB42_9ACTN|nr:MULTISPECIES: TetR/AcrR family transcriptional regulator [Gordonia]KNA90822.1 TetR family transcriptional regulator [Gordonia jacobaea]OBC04336.1 TetR family transcriptional regulator [Gordonia sp. 852002-50395_SCH5434458]